jgi:integrase
MLGIVLGTKGLGFNARFQSLGVSPTMSPTEYVMEVDGMPKQTRFKTKYPGVYYVEGTFKDGGPERIYYIVYRRNGKLIEEKAGRQFQDDMTPARANMKRLERIKGDELTNQERRQAEQAAKEAERAVKEAEEDRWTIAKLWDLYGETFSQNKALHHEGKKFDNYLREEFGGKEPSEILALDVDRLRIRLQKKGKNTTAARVLELLRRTINFGIKRGLVTPLLFKIEIPKLNNEVTEDLTEEQIRKLLQALDVDPDQKAASVMRLALYSGMRRSEILGLKWEHLNYERGFIKLADPKGKKDQVIPMNTAVRRTLESIQRQEDNPYVFPGKKPGAHLTECRISFNRIKAAAGIPRNFRPCHGLRHVFGSNLASSGIDLYTISKLLTHKSTLMSQRYSHIRDQALRQASELAGDLIDKAANGGREQQHSLKLVQ